MSQIPQNIGSPEEAILFSALRAGQGQAFNQQFAQGQSLVADARNRQNQMDALALARDQLQQQSQQARLSRATPTSRPAPTPFTRTVERARDQFPQTVSQPSQPGFGTVSGGGESFSIDATEAITGFRGEEQLSQQEIQQRGGFVQGQQRDPRPPMQIAKENLVSTFPGLSDEAKQTLNILASDPSIDLAQLTIRAEKLRESASTRRTTKQQQFSARRSLIRDQVRDIDDQVRDIENRLFDEFGFDPTGATPEEAAEKFGIQEGFFTDTPANETAIRLFEDLTRLKNQKRSLRTKEQSLIAGTVTQAQSKNTPETAGNVSDISDEELFKIARQ